MGLGTRGRASEYARLVIRRLAQLEVFHGWRNTPAAGGTQLPGGKAVILIAPVTALMFPRAALILALVLLLATSGCAQDVSPIPNPGNAYPGDPGRRFLLRDEQIRLNERLAAQGDTAAVTRLINHYQWWASDPVRARFWLRRGAELGDHMAMLNLALQIYGPGGEANCREAESLLVGILETAPSKRLEAEATDLLESLRTDESVSSQCYQWLGQ